MVKVRVTTLNQAGDAVQVLLANLIVTRRSPAASSDDNRS
jgi:hypothetical protein